MLIEKKSSWAQKLIPVIPAIQEATSGGSQFEASPDTQLARSHLKNLGIHI
jgi:hypothetical protein